MTDKKRSGLEVHFLDYAVIRESRFISRAHARKLYVQASQDNYRSGLEVHFLDYAVIRESRFGQLNRARSEENGAIEAPSPAESTSLAQ